MDKAGYRDKSLDYGGKAIVMSNTNGNDPENFFYQICTQTEKHSFVEYHAPSHENPHLPAEELAKLQHDNPPLVYQQEYLAEFVDWTGNEFFQFEKLLVDGEGVPMPTTCDVVFCTIDTAVKDRSEHDGTAVVYWSFSRFTNQLVVLDWDIVQIEGSLLEAWLPGVYQRLNELARQCRARMGSIGAFIEDKLSGTILLQQAARRSRHLHASRQRNRCNTPERWADRAEQIGRVMPVVANRRRAGAAQPRPALLHGGPCPWFRP